MVQIAKAVQERREAEARAEARRAIAALTPEEKRRRYERILAAQDGPHE